MNAKKMLLCGMCLSAVFMTGIIILNCNNVEPDGLPIIEPEDDQLQKTADSLALVRLNDSLKVVDSLKNIKYLDSLRTVDSLKYAQRLDSLSHADTIAYLRMLDSLRLVNTLIADSLRKVDSLRVADSLEYVRKLDSIRLVDSLAAVAYAKRYADSVKIAEDNAIQQSKEEYPKQVANVIGCGYDITSLYANQLSVKNPVLDFGKLVYNRLIHEDPGVKSFIGETIEGATVSQYQQNLSTRVNVSASASGFGASFSSQVKTAFDSERSSSHAYAFATYRANMSIIGYKIIDRSKLSSYLTEDFKNDVNNLTPQNLMEKYGTHVTLNGIFGGRIDYNMSIAKTSNYSYDNLDVYVRAKADADVVVASGSVDVTVETSNSIKASFVENSEKIKTLAYGGDVSIAHEIHNTSGKIRPGLWSAWSNSINTDNMTFCEYYDNSLFLISDLVTNQAKKKAIEDEIKSYLKSKEINISEALVPRSYVFDLDKRIVGKRISGDQAMLPNGTHPFLWEIAIKSVTLTDKQPGNNTFNTMTVAVKYTIDENKGDGPKYQTIYVKEDTINVDIHGKEIVSVRSGYLSQTKSGSYASNYNWTEVVTDGNGLIQEAWIKSGDREDQVGYHIKKFYVEFFVKEPVTANLGKKKRFK